MNNASSSPIAFSSLNRANDILDAIQQTINALAAGLIDAATARTILYGLQIASANQKRIEKEAAPEPQRAAAEPSEPQETAHAIAATPPNLAVAQDDVQEQIPAATTVSETAPHSTEATPVLETEADTKAGLPNTVEASPATPTEAPVNPPATTTQQPRRLTSFEIAQQRPRPTPLEVARQYQQQLERWNLARSGDTSL